jgi:hypothetical protein
MEPKNSTISSKEQIYILRPKNTDYSFVHLAAQFTAMIISRLQKCKRKPLAQYPT